MCVVCIYNLGGVFQLILEALVKLNLIYFIYSLNDFLFVLKFKLSPVAFYFILMHVLNGRVKDGQVGGIRSGRG